MTTHRLKADEPERDLRKLYNEEKVEAKDCKRLFDIPFWFRSS